MNESTKDWNTPCAFTGKDTSHILPILCLPVVVGGGGGGGAGSGGAGGVFFFF